MNHDQVRTAPADGARDPRAGDAEEVLARVTGLLGSADMVAALRYLNGRTRFRFTGIFQVDPPMLRNLRLFDRENPTLNVSGAVATLDIGYCGVACASQAPFVTEDARADPRLESHPARTSMISYAGVPIRMPGGIPWGTLCHFDVRPRLVPPGEIRILESVTTLFAEWMGRFHSAS